MAAHILVACGNGIATSTVVASKIKTPFFYLNIFISN